MPDEHANTDDWLPGLNDPVEIGRGGFGVVYKARQTDLNRTVAVKILSGTLDDLALQRFDRERRAMGALSGHPNIVPIYSTGLTADQRPYLVMEFLPGGSMAERTAADGPLVWRAAADVGVRLCAALETAHRAGVLHRDVKPENIFVSGLGVPKLGDFGIARLEGAPQTQSAMITASLAHAAPELIDGKKPSVQSDVYGLASTIVTLMTGAPPFSRDTDDSIVPLLARIATEPLPDLRPRGVPDVFCRVFEQAMAKDPGDRFESVAEFGRAIQAGQSSSQVDVTPLEVQGIDPTITPGSGAPRVESPTVSLPDPGGVSAPPPPPPPPPATTPPARPTSTPPSVTTPAPPGTTAAPGPPTPPPPTSVGAATTTGPPPGRTSGDEPIGAPASVGPATIETPDRKKLWIGLAVAAAVVLVVLIAVGTADKGTGPDAGPEVTRGTLFDRPGSTEAVRGPPSTLVPGSVGEHGLTVTEIPFDFGDAPALDGLAAECAAGTVASCDELIDIAPEGTLYQEFAASCGGRTVPEFGGPGCESRLGL